MTIETRTALEPKDILGIEIECKNCKYRSIRPVSTFYGTPVTCPNCNQSWLPMREEFDRLSKLANFLNHFSTWDSDAVAIRFEIAQPQPKDRP